MIGVQLLPYDHMIYCNVETIKYEPLFVQYENVDVCNYFLFYDLNTFKQKRFFHYQQSCTISSLFVFTSRNEC